MAKTKFQTIVDIPDFRWNTGYQSKSMFMGSCFTENIGGIMENHKYPVDINPFGILYNPMSVANGLEILLKERSFSNQELIQYNGIWHSFSHHGRFSSVDVNETLANINNRIQQSARFLNEAEFLFITFGTSWIYRHKESGDVVSNCHKIPAKEFTRERISVESIASVYSDLLQKLFQLNANLKVVFTVSPIRHWKDGAIENQRSKATLLLAVDQLIQLFGEEKCAYFPSYEIVMDELRDYRFYAEDMLHLSDVAVQHIWEKFEENLIDPKSQVLAKEVSKIMHAVRHRPLNKKSTEFYNFLTSFLKKITELESKHPFLNLKLEKEYFNVQIQEYEQGKRKI